jgi:hypothetical protein
VKLVADLPAVEDAATLASIIREGQSAFFLRNGVPLATTGVRARPGGLALAAAVDAPYVETIWAACRRHRWCLGLVAPMAVALPHAIADPRFTWADGNLVLEIEHAQGTLESIRTRLAFDTAPTAPPQPVASLIGLGDVALQYAAAYGAAVLPPGESLALHPAGADSWNALDVQRRLIVPGLLTCTAVVGLLMSPLGAVLATRKAERRLAAVGPDRLQTVATTLAELDRVTDVLVELRDFADTRPDVMTVLTDVASRLPDSSALVALELEGAQVRLVILTSQPAAAVAALSEAPSVATVQLVGPDGVGVARSGPHETVMLRLGLKARAP